MNRSVVLLVLVGIMLPPSMFAAVRVRDRQMHELKKLHKQEWKELKSEQRATRKVLKHHFLTPEARQRLKHNFKMQRKLLRASQKVETHRLKEKHAAGRHGYSSFHFKPAPR